MKFIFADSLDMVDPAYDFIKDVNGPGRRMYWDDLYPHEIMDSPPYDGILVSRAIVGDHLHKGKYTESQSMRFRRVGARAFLRLDKPRFAEMPIYGDCGAFSYVKEPKPPFSVEDMADFYEECGFDFGCSVDHIIFDFECGLKGLSGASAEARERFDITLENAERFLKVARKQNARFKPMGVIQGWSPASMAEAGKRLVKMGYDYLAIGGMVPLKSDQIHEALDAIRAAVPAKTKLHILGFTKIDDWADFERHKIYSVDSTSPLIRAFKDARNNYYAPQTNGTLKYFTALRVPQALENPKLMRLIKRGDFSGADLVKLEQAALGALRAYDAGKADVEDALERLLDYASVIEEGRTRRKDVPTLPIKRLRTVYRETLEQNPWKTCPCAICRSSGIEVAIFRASNRNKRRGIHNLAVVYDAIQRLNQGTSRT
jgi:hypothetical protein